MSSSVAATSAGFATSRTERRIRHTRTRRIARAEIAALVAIAIALAVALVTGVSHAQDGVRRAV